MANPLTLYQTCLCAVAKKFALYQKYPCILATLPNNVFFDIHYEVFKIGDMRSFATALSNVITFSKLLTVTNCHMKLLESFQSLMSCKIEIAEKLKTVYCISPQHPFKICSDEKLVNMGINIGEFLNEAGDYQGSMTLLSTVVQLCAQDNSTPEQWRQTLECCQRLLHAQAAYCSFNAAKSTYDLALQMVEKLEKGEHEYNRAALYTEFSILHYLKSEYDQAHRWSIKALKELKPTLPRRVIIDVLRQAGKTCVLKGKFQEAELLIGQALYLAKEIYNVNHPVYSYVLADYAFYSLNFDKVSNSTRLYKMALNIKESIFTEKNLHVALAHEELAYALYVKEYRSGKLSESRLHAETAIRIKEEILSKHHLLLANARKTIALILEEMVIHHASPRRELCQVKTYHLFALSRMVKCLGQQNIQTAKQYGNLGRLYQTMEDFEMAEEMHKKAISIKETILGPDDYEVSVSIGHLASLYSYNMKRYKDAEKLYYRCIAIGLKWLGETYSGLWYYYLELAHIYAALDDMDKVTRCGATLQYLISLQEKRTKLDEPPLELNKRPQPIQDVIDTFFSMRKRVDRSNCLDRDSNPDLPLAGQLL